MEEEGKEVLFVRMVRRVRAGVLLQFVGRGDDATHEPLLFVCSFHTPRNDADRKRSQRGSSCEGKKEQRSRWDAHKG